MKKRFQSRLPWPLIDSVFRASGELTARAMPKKFIELLPAAFLRSPLQSCLSQFASTAAGSNLSRARAPRAASFAVTLSRFQSDTSGATAIIFGVMAVVMLTFVGVGLDFARWMNARNQTMSALDAAVLAAGRALQTNGGSTAEALAVAKLYYAQGTKSRLKLATDTVSFKIDAQGTAVSAVGEATITTPLLGLLNVKTLPVVSLTAANSPTAKLSVGENAKISIEMSMILDMSGSMNEGTKLPDLKLAAQDLVDIIVWQNQSQYTSKVSLVPYATAVNAGSYADAARGKPILGGCKTLGCLLQALFNPYGTPLLYSLSSCVTERTGAHAYKDTDPKTAPVGPNYPSLNNPCVTQAVTPLTNNKDTLTSAIKSLKAGGSTAGQIGIAWGWYTLSPKWSDVWPASSRPTEYGLQDVRKIAVLMSDGEYNSSYCKGVISQDSTNGSGSILDKINCNASNGNAYDQSEKMCAAMKQAGVTVYTVGFNLINSADAVDLMTNCASTPNSFYNAANGEQLRQAFRDIALKVSTLYLTQ